MGGHGAHCNPEKGPYGSGQFKNRIRDVKLFSHREEFFIAPSPLFRMAAAQHSSLPDITGPQTLKRVPSVTPIGIMDRIYCLM